MRPEPLLEYFRDPVMLTHVLSGNGSPLENQGPGFANLNMLRGYSGAMQKKVTRGNWRCYVWHALG